MAEVFGNYRIWLIVLIVVGGSTALAVDGMLLVRKKVSIDTLTSCHEVAG